MAYRPTQRIIEAEQRIRAWKIAFENNQYTPGINFKSIADLDSELYGNVVLPCDPCYDRDRQESNPAFQAYPQMIVYCEVVEDVRLSLQFARAFSLRVACRAGGHSTAGYSVNDGMVIDVSRMNSVCVDPQRKLARVGAGTNFGRLNAHLNDYGLHVPGGACEHVCVAGYMQGGGYGYTSRKFGMNCDNVQSFQMMLRDGRVVTASARENDDLFWAVRGGTGGNFGVLLEITYQLHKLEPVWGFARVWDIDQAAGLLEVLQADYMRTGAAPELGYMGNLASYQGQKQFVLQGLYIGSEAEGRRALEALNTIARPLREQETLLPYARMDGWLDKNPYPIPDMSTGAKEDKLAGYIEKPLYAADWQDVVDYYKTTPCDANTVVIEPYGGAINEVPVGENAFIHRNVDMDFFVDVFWQDESEKPAAVAWLEGYRDCMKNYFNGHVYQNYPSRSLTDSDYRSMYFGSAFDRLLAVKNKYDPAPCFFEFEQSIKPYDQQSPVSATSNDPRVEGVEIELDIS